jgi:hypothetical protein
MAFDKHIESAKTLDGCFRKRFDLIALRHVHCLGESLASSRYDLANDLVQMTMATGTECDLRALCRQMAGNSFANATPGSSDSNDLILDVRFHS